MLAEMPTNNLQEEKKMQKGIIGKKIGMTQIFDEKGKVIPVTVVEAGPCVVTQKKTVENDGYDAVQVGFGDVKPTACEQAPHRPLRRRATSPPRRPCGSSGWTTSAPYNVGDMIKADTFAGWRAAWTSPARAKVRATPA